MALPALLVVVARAGSVVARGARVATMTGTRSAVRNIVKGGFNGRTGARIADDVAESFIKSTARSTPANSRLGGILGESVAAFDEKVMAQRLDQLRALYPNANASELSRLMYYGDGRTLGHGYGTTALGRSTGRAEFKNVSSKIEENLTALNRRTVSALFNETSARATLEVIKDWTQNVSLGMAIHDGGIEEIKARLAQRVKSDLRSAVKSELSKETGIPVDRIIWGKNKLEGVISSWEQLDRDIDARIYGAGLIDEDQVDPLVKSRARELERNDVRRLARFIETAEEKQKRIKTRREKARKAKRQAEYQKLLHDEVMADWRELRQNLGDDDVVLDCHMASEVAWAWAKGDNLDDLMDGLDPSMLPVYMRS